MADAISPDEMREVMSIAAEPKTIISGWVSKERGEVARSGEAGGASGRSTPV